MHTLCPSKLYGMHDFPYVGKERLLQVNYGVASFFLVGLTLYLIPKGALREFKGP